MVTFRPTKILARRLHLPMPAKDVPIVHPLADWCAHTFTADRHRYLIVTNTHSLFSAVTRGVGVTSEDAFVRRAAAAIRETLGRAGHESAWIRQIEPALMAVRFASFNDRGVMGSMNELIFLAKVHLIEDGLGGAGVSERINETPMSRLWKRGPAIRPRDALDLLVREDTQ
jgi:hypothetical protein